VVTYLSITFSFITPTRYNRAGAGDYLLPKKIVFLLVYKNKALPAAGRFLARRSLETTPNRAHPLPNRKAKCHATARKLFLMYLPTETMSHSKLHFEKTQPADTAARKGKIKYV